MIAALTNHLWQSTLFVLAAWLVAAALRGNGAHVRHRIWLIASLKFLVPFSCVMALGSALPAWLPAAPPAVTAVSSAAPDFSVAVDRLAEPFTDAAFLSSTPETLPASTDLFAAALAGAWAAGCVVIALNRFHNWRRIRAAVRASMPAALAASVPVRSSPTLLEPGVVGVWRPVLLLPAGIEQHLTPAQLDAVLTHELCHVQRRDNLTSAIHMIVEAAFWFHPLVWFVGARLIDERERACDEHVLRVCGEPQVYAESILNVCKLYVASPLACVSGVGGPASPKPFFGGGGADLRKRVAAILVNRIGRQLSPARKTALAIAAVLAIALPLVAGMLAPPLGALAEAQTAKADQTFDVVSIKPCDANSPTVDRGTPPPPGGRNGVAPWAAQASPGSVYWHCATLAQLVVQAYADRDHPLRNVNTQLTFSTDFQPKHVRGGPAWATTDKFTIDARLPVDVTQAVLSGRATRAVVDLPVALSQALRATLEDRFQLKVHRATEERDMYALKVGKNGLNKERIGATKPGDCVTRDAYFAADPATQRALRICGSGFSGRGGTEYTDITLRTLAEDLSAMMDHYVLDQTGVEGTFTFTLQYATGATTPDDRLIGGLEPLGLKIDRTKGPAEYLVIDSAQKPRPNAPSPDRQ